MKKSIVFFSLIISMVVSGCTLFKAGPETVSLTGILSEQTANDEYNGSHVLTSSDGQVTPLNSLSLNLSDPAYLGNEVKITGTVNEDTNVLEVVGLTVVEVLSKIGGQGAFAEYENTDLGFKLKYYDDWSIEEEDSKVTFVAPSKEAIDEETSSDSTTAEVKAAKISISQSPFEYTPTSYEDGTTDTPLQAYVGRDNPDYATTKVDISKDLRKIGPDMMDALVLYDDCGGMVYDLYRNGFIYEISFECDLTDPNREEYLKVFDSMVSTFRFIGIVEEDSGDLSDTTADDTPTDTSDTADTADTVTPQDLPTPDTELAEFQSTSFGFKALYPKNWYYEGSNTLESGILYHYGFSDKALDEGGTELVGLDLMSGDMPSGTSLSGYGFDGVKVSSGDETSVYVKIENRIYRLKGLSEYENLMLNMAAGIQKLEEE